MKINKLTFVSLLSALFIAAGTFTPGYAVGNKPPTKAPTGADCQAQALAAAEAAKQAGKSDKAQQAAYAQAKMKCRDRM